MRLNRHAPIDTLEDLFVVSLHQDSCQILALPPALLSVPGPCVGGQPLRRGPDTGSNSSPEGLLGPHVFPFTQCLLEVICAVEVAE